MTDYSWPDWGNYRTREAAAEAVWAEAVRALPVDAAISGEVIGRQPFGVFLAIDNHPDAIGLAKITAMPHCMELPPLGARVTGRVLWHADHNHQVGIKIAEWDEHVDLLPSFAGMIGQTVAGQVTKIAPIGAFVRIADCVEGLIRQDDLPSKSVAEGQELPVTILSVDPERRRILLSAQADVERRHLMQQPILNLSSWSIEDVEAHMAGLPRGQQLEQVRVVAQTHVYRSTEPRDVRLRWAKLSLAANRLFHGDDPWAQARMSSHEFSLRTWVIEHLGPDADPDWNPEALARDTFAALSLEPERAKSIAADWRDLPTEQIGALRRHKNLTAHLDRLTRNLPPGHLRDQLEAWAAVREHLP